MKVSTNIVNHSTMILRKCNICNEDKLLTCDYFYKNNRGYYDGACKICRSARKPGPKTIELVRLKKVNEKLRKKIHRLREKNKRLVKENVSINRKLSLVAQRQTQHLINSNGMDGMSLTSIGAEMYIARLLRVEHIGGSNPIDLGKGVEVKSSYRYNFKLQPNRPYKWLVLVRQWQSRGIIYRHLFLLAKQEVLDLGLNHASCYSIIKNFEVTPEQLIERFKNYNTII